MDYVAIFTLPKFCFGDLISVRIHAAHDSPPPGRVQENTPDELCMSWFRARGYHFSDGIGTLPLEIILRYKDRKAKKHHKNRKQLC